ncbi:methyltransferase family protein [Spiribacter insolitus]|uniref:Isoprenylcysteine carboxylmethyltransferase family protein n=1 Tax=Spiribacter insolitus TaxID=3122417 RepID=A0ABV3T6T1_9GAMM
MSTRLPPPLLLLLAGIGAWAIDRWWPSARLELSGQATLAVILAGLSVAVMMISAIWFARAHTTINPMHPEQTRHLITTGPYARSRNPIYLADALLLFAWILWLGNVASLVMLPAFTVALTVWQIRPEEEALATKFGEDYRAYCRRTRRWL